MEVGSARLPTAERRRNLGWSQECSGEVSSDGGEHCYYHGQVRGEDDSNVALSTCNGLQIQLHDPTHCAGGPPSSGAMTQRNWMPRNVFEEMKYLEIMIVSDHNMYKRHKTKQHTRNFAKSVVNFVDAIFKEHLHTRVVLVAVEIWTDKDQIPISVKPLDMLKDFSKYRAQSIKQHADAVHLFTNVTFHYRRSSAAYFGGLCSVSRGVGVNEYGSTWTMASSLSQSLAQNLGIQWDPAAKRNYKEFLLKGGGSCLFNRPNKLFESTECGNGYIEVGEECDCGARSFYPRGYSCRYAVNDCDISETCSGDSGQCPPNLHKQDGYHCQVNQGRCYGGECKTRGNQCKYLWGPKAGGSEKFCYEKLNTEGTEKGNCGMDGEKWLQCSKHDVFCGFLLCSNIGRNPRIGMMKGDITPTSFNHQGRLVDCSGGHVLLDDETDLGYVEDGTPCGPSMMCLDRKCLPIQSLNMSACPSGPNSQVCSAHGVSPGELLPPIGPSATNLIIGSIAGAILVAAIVLGGTGWGFKW
ncbi:unnamed protein product [Coregonus sp. 'balchen']|nr:unnamed protein product [Coregonus sp. 'balchen']